MSVVRWEYQILKVRLPEETNVKSTDDILNELGAECWELVGFTTAHPGEGLYRKYYFKRRVD